jgi:uncharacterized membrane protein
MKRILYLGDTHLRDAAAYLSGLLSHWGWDFDYLPSDQRPNRSQWQQDYGLFILSDYPAANFGAADHKTLLDRVANGAGLLMIGGWESFHGVGGDWDGTPLGKALPVEISRADDRRNCDRPVLVRQVIEHSITRDLPWGERPPVVGGFNQVRPKPDAQVLLEACIFDAKCTGGEQFTFQLAERHPLLVAGQWKIGRTAALMTDVAPHWVGPLVDWGTPRVAAQAPNANAVEVGGYYAQLLRQLLEWTAGA